MSLLPRHLRKDKYQKKIDRREGKEEMAEIRDTINSLKQRILDLETALSDKEGELAAFLLREKRIRIHTSSSYCRDCSSSHPIYIAFFNRKLYTDVSYDGLVRRLEGMGYYIKRNGEELPPKIPKEGVPFDGECDYLGASILDLRDLSIPDGVPPTLLEDE